MRQRAVAYHTLIYFNEVDKAVTSQRGNSRNSSRRKCERRSDHFANCKEPHHEPRKSAAHPQRPHQHGLVARHDDG